MRLSSAGPSRLAAIMAALLIGGGCGGGESETTSAGAGGTSAGGSGPGPGSGGSGGGVGGGNGPVTCPAAFVATGTPEPVLMLPAGELPNSPSLTADELDLYYVHTVNGIADSFVHATRATTSEPFSAGTPVAELDSVCPAPDLPGTIDVSSDGLRAYFSCIADIYQPPFSLHMAERSSASQPFVDKGELGQLGCCASLDDTELHAYSNGTLAGMTLYYQPVALATRATKAEPFGAPQAVAGLEMTNLASPGISANGLALVGALPKGSPASFWYTTRASTDAPFANGSAIAVAFDAWGAPELSHDCRSLYFVGFQAGTNVSGVYRLRASP